MSDMIERVAMALQKECGLPAIDDRGVGEDYHAMARAAIEAYESESKAEIERLRELLGELRNLAVPQNGRGCLYCGTMDFENHKPVCEFPEIERVLEKRDERK